jgi:hypothetical protein
MECKEQNEIANDFSNDWLNEFLSLNAGNSYPIYLGPGHLVTYRRASLLRPDSVLPIYTILPCKDSCMYSPLRPRQAVNPCRKPIIPTLVLTCACSLTSAAPCCPCNLFDFRVHAAGLIPCQP